MNHVLRIAREATAAGMAAAAVVLCSVSSGIDLPLEARTQNVNGYCTWCCLATLAKTHGVQRARSIARDVFLAHGGGLHPGYTNVVEAELNRRGVRHILQKDGVKHPAILERYADPLGAVVTLSAGNSYSGRNAHSVIVTRFGPETVEFWCPDGTKDKQGNPKTWKCSRAWFDQWWSGAAIVIFPDDQNSLASR